MRRMKQPYKGTYAVSHLNLVSLAAVVRVGPKLASLGPTLTTAARETNLNSYQS